MSEEINESPEAVIERGFNALLDVKPSLVSNTVPANQAEAKAAFLAGEARKPDAKFAKLEGNNLEVIEDLSRLGDSLLRDASVLQPKFIHEYRSYVEWAKGDTRLGYLMDCYNKSQDETEKQAIKSEFMKINIEIFGSPEKGDYQSAIHEKIDSISALELTGRAAEIRSELLELVADIPKSYKERYAPSKEALEWYKRAVEALCEPMLERIPADKEVFTGDEIEQLFDDILRNVFEDAGAEWKVVREKGSSVNVRAKDKSIVVPIGYADTSREKVIKLIGHELGVHLLRSVMGSETNMPILGVGLSNYYDSEEGQGKAAEHALSGEYEEAGLDHLITAGLVYHGGRDFRDTFEIKWRLKVLENVNDTDVTEQQITTARGTAYDNTMRTLRGTGELPWFKDLAYYYGPVKAWKHIESIIGDEFMLTLMMLGKTDPTNHAHRSVQLESSAKGIDKE